MRNILPSSILALAVALMAMPAAAQTPPTPVTQLVSTGQALVAGDVTFSNFTLPTTMLFPPGPLTAVDDMAASTAVNADGSVSLVFTAIDPATGAPRPITAEFQHQIAYDVTVTNPAFLLNAVNQQFGPATNVGFNSLEYREPLPSFVNLDDVLISDNVFGHNVDGTLGVSRGGVLYPLSCQRGGPTGCASPLPGGNRASLGLQNYFGVILDNRFGFTGGATPSVDSIAMTFTLVPATTPVTPIAVTLAGIDVSIPGTASVGLADTVDPTNSLVIHPGFAPAGGVLVTLTTSNAAALPLPASVTMPQGSRVWAFPVGAANVDAPTPVTATASFNGVTVSQTVTVNPAVPLTLASLQASAVIGLPNSLLLVPVLNRVNGSPAVIALTSSNPAVAAVPASFTIPALSPVGSAFFRTTTQPVGVDTSVTFSASLNGTTVSQTVTLPKTVDQVAITKAELVVKNGQLKVDATSTVPSAVLTLSNAATGAVIGTMTNTGLSGSGAKYSFQGTVSPVTTLRLISNFSGTATGAVAQK